MHLSCPGNGAWALPVPGWGPASLRGPAPPSHALSVKTRRGKMFLKDAVQHVKKATDRVGRWKCVHVRDPRKRRLCLVKVAVPSVVVLKWHAGPLASEVPAGAAGGGAELGQGSQTVSPCACGRRGPSKLDHHGESFLLTLGGGKRAQSRAPGSPTPCFLSPRWVPGRLSVLGSPLDTGPGGTGGGRD